jgi:hypothetical protein
MKTGSLWHIFNGVSGEPELGRFLFFIVGVSYCIYAGMAMYVLHQSWNPIEFSTGAAVVLGAGAGGIALKDRSVAVAKQTTPDSNSGTGS